MSEESKLAVFVCTDKEIKCSDCGEVVDSAGGCDCLRKSLTEEREKANEFITILDLAKFRGVKEDSSGSINGNAFQAVGLPIMGGCQNCAATLVAYNMCPTKTGNCSCLECVHAGIGFETVEEANRFCFPDEYKWQGVKIKDQYQPVFDSEDDEYPDEIAGSDYE